MVFFIFMQPYEREFFDIDSSYAALIIVKGEREWTTFYHY